MPQVKFYKSLLRDNSIHIKGIRRWTYMFDSVTPV